MPNFRSIRLFVCTALFAATLHAQMHRVEAPEKVTRAIGVYEWTGDLAKPTAARLVPVSVFIDSNFQDGGTYYARPIPLALLNGNIYSLEKAGLPQGTVTLDYARHLQPAASGSEDTNDLGWFGYGTFATMPAPRKTVALHASSATPVIISSKDDDRPTLIRRNTDTTTPGGSSSASAPSPAPADDPDRPRFSKTPATTPASTTPASTTPASTTTTTPTTTKPDDGSATATPPPPKDPTDDTDRPTLRHRDPKQAEADRKARDHGSVTAVGSLNDDPDRPNMRRGKTAGIGGDPAPQLTGVPVGLHQIVAVSDPTNREPHPFAREWATPTERAETLTKLEAIAQQQLIDYARTNGATQPPAPTAKPRPGTRARRTPPAPAAPLPTAPLASEDIAPYTLSYGGLPTFVYTAISTPASASATAPALPERYITVVAQQVPSGELQVAFASVTDAAHLDRTPWFRLIDAVDPDAEHRASLLFELRGHSSRQFALYRILSARADQIFITSPTD
jgi:hypothetical protein